MPRSSRSEQPAWNPLQVPVGHPDRERYLKTYGQAAAAALLDEPNLQQKFTLDRSDRAGHQAIRDAYHDYAPSEIPDIVAAEDTSRPPGRVAARRIGLGMGAAVLVAAVAAGAAANRLPGMDSGATHRPGEAAGASPEGHKSRITPEEQAQAERILNDATGCYALGDSPLSTRTFKVQGERRQFVVIPIEDTSTHTEAQDHWASSDGKNNVSLQGSTFLANMTTYGGKPVTDGGLPGFITPEPGITEHSTDYNLLLEATPGHPGERVASIEYAAAAGIVNDNGPLVMVGAERSCGRVSFTVKPNGEITNPRVLPASLEVGALKPLQDPYAALGGNMPPTS